MLTNWLPSLKDQAIFSPQPFANVDAVTGATVSSKAVLESLAQSGSTLCISNVLGQTAQQRTTAAARWLPDLQGVYLICCLSSSLLLLYIAGASGVRLFVLAFNVLIGGIFLNAQFSTEQIASLLSFAIPLAVPTGVFILTVGAPLLAIAFRQYLLRLSLPLRRFAGVCRLYNAGPIQAILSREQMHKDRFVKFVVLFVFIAAFFLSRNHNALAIDPLIKVFSFRHFDEFLLFIVAVALVGSLFYSRFWCRYLCPAGAFLSLFNKIAIFSRYMPAKRYANCEYGLSINDKLDCIYCDKCRFEKNPLSPNTCWFWLSLFSPDGSCYRHRYFRCICQKFRQGITGLIDRRCTLPSAANPETSMHRKSKT